MYRDAADVVPQHHARWTDLPPDEALLLWSLRRMVIAWPRCHAVHAALHARHGDAALGVEHLLRCLLIGVARHARRPLHLGDPACAVLVPDEAALLFVLRAAGRPAAVRAALTALCGDEGAACLSPLADALAAATAV